MYRSCRRPRKSWAVIAPKNARNITLDIPLISLGSKKHLRRLPAQRLRPPFGKFIAGTDDKADTGNQEEEPLSRPERRNPQLYLADHDDRNESLVEMAKTVVVVTGKVEQSCSQKPSGSLA